jgi:RNA polymerase sigma factor (sigma-70 family)
MLLEQFAVHGDEAAFTELVHRYGSLVLGVCERVLQDVHDAEDAFQASFLVLVKKAGDLDRRGSLGNWLYAVAYRTAIKARTRAALRRRQQRQAQEMPALPTMGDSVWHELRPVLDEEINRLPEKYRTPLVLCYLEGKTNQQAAHQLGWPEGSMSRRLARARELLRKRLLGRGLALSSVLLMTLLLEKSRAAVSASLAQTTVRAALLYKQGLIAASGAVSSEAASLAEEVLASLAKAPQKTGLFMALGTRRGRFVAAAMGLLLLLVGIGTTTAVIQRDSPPPLVPLLLSTSQCTCKFCQSGAGLSGLQLQKVFRGPQAPARSLAFSPDDQMLASGTQGPEPVIVLWGLKTGKEIFSLKGHRDSIVGLAFSADGKMLVSGSHDQTARLWSVTDRRQRFILEGHEGSVLAVALSSKGDLAASASADETVKLWSVATGRERATLRGHRSPVCAVAFSPDGATLASGGQDGSIILWDAEAGQRRTVSSGHGSAVFCIAFSPDGNHLATGGADQDVKLWDKNLKPLATIRAHTDQVRNLVFSSEGSRQLFSGSPDMMIRSLPLPDGTGPTWVQSLASAFTVLAFDRGGHYCATGGEDNMVKVWLMEQQITK